MEHTGCQPQINGQCFQDKTITDLPSISLVAAFQSFFFFLVYSYHLELLKLKFPKIQSLNFFIFMSTLSLLENSLISMASNHLSTEYTQVDIFTMILCLRLSRVYTNPYLTTSLGSKVIMLNLTCPKFSSWTPTFPQTEST